MYYVTRGTYSKNVILWKQDYNRPGFLIFIKVLDMKDPLYVASYKRGGSIEADACPGMLIAKSNNLETLLGQVAPDIL